MWEAARALSSARTVPESLAAPAMRTCCARTPRSAHCRVLPRVIGQTTGTFERCAHVRAGFSVRPRPNAPTASRRRLPAPSPATTALDNPTKARLSLVTALVPVAKGSGPEMSGCDPMARRRRSVPQKQSPIRGRGAPCTGDAFLKGFHLTDLARAPDRGFPSWQHCVAGL